MRDSIIFILTGVVILVAGIGGFAAWWAYSDTGGWPVRDAENYKITRPVGEGPAEASSVVTTGPGEPAENVWDAWDCYRGPEFNLVSPEQTELADSWPDGGPGVLWTIKVGEGYASPASHGGKLFMLDYDHEKQGDVLRCLSLADGRDIWRHFYKVPTRGDHGVTRTIPAVTSEYVVTISPQCYLLCADAQTGKYLWSKDLVSEYGTAVPNWYAGQCPIIDDDKAIIAPAGKKLMVAFDCKSGKEVWTTPNPLGWKMTHSSITPMDFDGQRMYVYCASGGVVGVDAETGRILWEHPGWIVPTANVPAPVVVGDDRIFVTGGYGAGSRMLRLKRLDGGGIVADVDYSLSQRVFSTYQQTPIYYKKVLFGVMTKKAGGLKEQLVCFEPDSKRMIWSSGKKNRFGWGPWVVADDKIFLVNDTGILTMAEASTDGYRQLGRASVLDHAHETWGPLTIIAGRLLLRDLDRLVCIDLRKVQEAE